MIKKRLLILLVFVFLTSITKFSYAFDVSSAFRLIGYGLDFSQVLDAFKDINNIFSDEKKEREEEKEQETKD